MTARLRGHKQRKLNDRVYSTLKFLISARIIVNRMLECNVSAEIVMAITRYKRRFPLLFWSLGIHLSPYRSPCSPLPPPQKEIQQLQHYWYRTNKCGRFVYSHRLSSVSEMNWWAWGYVTTGLGLEKAGTQKNICHSHEVDAPNGSPAADKIKRGINKKAA